MTKSPSSTASSPPCGTTTESRLTSLCDRLRFATGFALRPASLRDRLHFATGFASRLISLRVPNTIALYTSKPLDCSQPRGFGFLSRGLVFCRGGLVFCRGGLVFCRGAPRLLFYCKNTHLCFILSAISFRGRMHRDPPPVSTLHFHLVLDCASLSWNKLHLSNKICHYGWSLGCISFVFSICL